MSADFEPPDKGLSAHESVLIKVCNNQCRTAVISLFNKQMNNKLPSALIVGEYLYFYSLLLI